MTKRFVPGLVLNVLAGVGALCVVPALLIPLMKVAFVGVLTNALVAGLLLLAGGLIINVGPVFGAVFAWRGVHRAGSIVTALASMGGLLALVVALQALGLQPLDEPGHADGPRPGGCRQVTPDGSAVARACNPDVGEAPAGDCPPGYFCLPRLANDPASTVCSISCRHDCECPDRFRCVFSKCVP